MFSAVSRLKGVEYFIFVKKKLTKISKPAIYVYLCTCSSKVVLSDISGIGGTSVRLLKLCFLLLAVSKGWNISASGR